MAAGEFAENAPQRMRRRQFVIAIRGDQEAACALNASPEEPYEVERGFVRPMQIFHDDRDEAIRLRERVDQPDEQLPARVLAGIVRIAGDGQRGGDLVHRTEGARRLQRVATTPHRAVPASRNVGERFDQRALACAGFAAQEHELAGTALGLLQAASEFVQLRLAFEELHGGSSVSGKVGGIGYRCAQSGGVSGATWADRPIRAAGPGSIVHSSAWPRAGTKGQH